MINTDEIVLLPLRGMEETALRIEKYLNEIGTKKVSILKVSLPRFSTGYCDGVCAY